jgi:hypothetical protein
MGFASLYPSCTLYSIWVTAPGKTARAQDFSIVIAGLDPAIHAENLLA